MIAVLVQYDHERYGNFYFTGHHTSYRVHCVVEIFNGDFCSHR